MPNCCNVITAAAVDIVGGALQITIPTTPLIDGRQYKIVVPASITLPAGIEALPVTVLNGADTIALWTCGAARSILGNRLICFGSQCCAVQYSIPVEYVNTGIATNPAHFAVVRRVK